MEKKLNILKTKWLATNMCEVRSVYKNIEYVFIITFIKLHTSPHMYRLDYDYQLIKVGTHVPNLTAEYLSLLEINDMIRNVCYEMKTKLEEVWG